MKAAVSFSLQIWVKKMEQVKTMKKRVPKYRDIRRYACEYCGIIRSKKTLIKSHIQSNHQDEIKEKKDDRQEVEKGAKKTVCEKCGVSFKKPAHLKQHMQGHSLERPFTCPVKDCNLSYRRKDHLTRHLIHHELLNCPIKKCTRKFSKQGDMERHVQEIHDKADDKNDENKHVCLEPGCGKAFRYASKLQKHENSHVQLETVEAFCGELGCMKFFTNKQCLTAHLQTCHQYINCEICGSKQLRKNIKRHLRTHEKGVSKERIRCCFEECKLTFSNNSNLRQHVKAAHLQEKPFVCSFSDCGMRFAYKHVRDNHEKTGRHVYTVGDFVEADAEFQSRPRGGTKRKLPAMIETLLKKRVLPPNESDCHDADYLSWILLGVEEE